MSRGLGAVQRDLINTLPQVVRDIKIIEHRHFKPNLTTGDALAMQARHERIIKAIALVDLLPQLYGEHYTRSDRNSVARAIHSLEKLGLVATWLKRMDRGKLREGFQYKCLKFKWCLFVELLSVEAIDPGVLPSTLKKS